MTILSEWLDRLPVKFKHSPNILGLIEILSNPYQDTQDVLDWMLSQTAIDDAEGEILDFKGELIGVRRPPLQETNVFTLCAPEDRALDVDNKYGLAPPDKSTGGYLTGSAGISSKTNPGAYMSDADYRLLIKAKASTFRKKATREIVYAYLLAFGIRAKIIEGVRMVELEPSVYNSINYWTRNYIARRGFRPAGVQITFKNQTQPDSEI